MKAVIFSIGSELLQGFLLDTNSVFLAQELTAVGVEVVGVRGVGDDQAAIVRAMKQAMVDADLLVCTGGVGPTADDLSREAVAEVCGEVPVVDPELLRTVESFFLRRGSTMPERNAKQAWLIPSAEALPNPMGTAPGWYVRTGDTRIILMPGVPREMMPMWRHEAVPRLLPFLGEASISSRTLKTIGIGESAVEEALRHLIDREHPVVSTYAKNDGVHIRIVARADTTAEAEIAVQRAEQDIREIMGSAVYGDLDTTLPMAVLQPLIDSQSTLSVWESGTAGQVISLLMSDPDTGPAIRQGKVEPAANVDGTAATDRLEHALNELRSESGSQYALGVLVRKGEADSMDRYDAIIDILVLMPHASKSTRHTIAAREMELGRRASLLAAEVFRAALMESTSAPQA